jgi:hypothetical protein
VLPFSHDQFLAVFAGYNEAVWPAQIGAYALAAVALWGIARQTAWKDRVATVTLTVFWLWTGIGYHALQFTQINAAAWGFGALFVMQGVLLLHAGLVRRELAFGRGAGARGTLGWGLVVYASLLYPLLGLLLGFRYPAVPTFGITPCPVTLFTFGLLLLCAPTAPRRVLLIPGVWSLVGGSAALLLGVPQDWLLLASGLTVFFMRRRTRARAVSMPR